MKKLNKIIGQLLILVLTMNLVAPVAFAETETKTEPEKACTAEKPDYEKLREEWNKQKLKNKKAYDKVFEEAQEKHHLYIGCMFAYAEDELMGSVENWNSPTEACLTSDKIKTIIQKTEPAEMLGPVLSEHNAYKDFLNYISGNFTDNAQVTDSNDRELSGLEALYKLRDQQGEISRQRDMELMSSMVAMDIAFNALKEMRIALVIHIHFQCSLKFLDKYRRSLAELREVIDALPGKLRDASVVK